MKPIALAAEKREILDVVGRHGCIEICTAAMTHERDAWRSFIEVYRLLESHMHMPWATYNKLATYLVEKGFLDKAHTASGRKNTNYIRTTTRGRLLVESGLALAGKTVDELEADGIPPVPESVAVVREARKK